MSDARRAGEVPPYLLQLRAASRRAAMLTAAGAVIVIGSLVYGSISLSHLSTQREQLIGQIGGLRANVDEAETRLASERDTLAKASAQIADLTQLQYQMKQQTMKLQGELDVAKQTINSANAEIQGLRCGLEAARSAINAFHQGQYQVAVELYTSALACAPNNAYLLNLKAYSLFKMEKFDEAIETERASLKADPDYAWGYFDLARFLCAAGPANLPQARTQIQTALAHRPGLLEVMRGDGEFRRLCRGIVP